MDNPLKIVGSSNQKESWASSKNNSRQEAIAKFNRLWLINPSQFDPNRNVMEMERIRRTEAILPDIEGKRVVDLGCAGGTMSCLMRDKGAIVEAVDVSSRALELINLYECAAIDFIQDYVPRTKLTDSTYDLVLASDLIAYIPEQEYRLFMSELSRLVKPDGFVVCSTPIDIYSVDSLERFIVLSETEFAMVRWKFSYHNYWLKVNNFLAAPERYVKAADDPDYRRLKLQERTGFSKRWFEWNSQAPLSLLWRLKSYFTIPVHRWFKKNRFILLSLEKLCKTIASESGISHAIWLGKRRPFIEYTPVKEQPIERKGKKQVWE